MAARAPLLGPGREGGGFYQRLRPPLGPRRFQGYGPASWPVSHLAGAVLHAQRSLPGPTRTPACIDRSPEERRTRHITAAVMRLHSLQVCLITRRQTCCFSAPPLSHTHSRREPGEGRRIRDGEMLIIRGEATDSSQYVFCQDYKKLILNDRNALCNMTLKGRSPPQDFKVPFPW